MRPFEPYGPRRFAHQRRGLAKLIATKGRCALLFDPGLGKTAVVLDYLSVLAQASGGQVRALVLAPLAAVDTWVIQARQYLDPAKVAVWAEVPSGTVRQKLDVLEDRVGKSAKGHKWRQRADRSLALDYWGRTPSNPNQEPAKYAALNAGTGPAIVIEVLNLDVLSQRAQVGNGSQTTADLLVRAVGKYAPDVIVIDESHRIKSPSSNVSRAAARLTRLAKRRIILTGTVMPHSPLDVWAQWRFMEPEAFHQYTVGGRSKPMTYSRFKDVYGVWGGWMGKQVIAFQNLDQMQDTMALNSCVARKADSLDLPPVTETILPVLLDSREQRVYDDLKKQLAAKLGPGTTITVPNRLAQLMRLRQVTSGFLPDDSGTMCEVGRTKVQTIKSLVRDTLTGESRIVIFAHFTHEIEMLRDALTEKGTRVDVIDGATPQAERVRIRKRFGSDDPQRIVLVAQTKTMSLAVNELVTASHAIFASLPQQRDDVIQAKGRLDRQGQTRPVTIWYAIAPKTVDEVILHSHQQCTDLESAMLAHVLDRG